MLCADSEWFKFSEPTLIITPPSPLNLRGGEGGVKKEGDHDSLIHYSQKKRLLFSKGEGRRSVGDSSSCPEG
jgi:hypothetical protein